MTTVGGFTIDIAIPSGEPDGLRIIGMSNWDGKGIVFPRSIFQHIRQREELQNAGVYILWGGSESSSLPQVYIGESDSPGPERRVSSHASGPQEKDFWTHAIAFTSERLNKAHTLYLESRLIQIASEAKRCNLDNSQTPLVRKLDIFTELQAEGFLKNMRLCLPILGVDFFEMPRVPQHVQNAGGLHIRADLSASDELLPQLPSMSPELLYLRESRASGQGYDGPEFVVLSGAKGTRHHTEAFQTNYHSAYQLREELLALGVLIEDGEEIQLTQDYSFTAPSTAAAVLMGVQVNGLIAWKDGAGRTLKDIRNDS